MEPTVSYIDTHTHYNKNWMLPICIYAYMPLLLSFPCQTTLPMHRQHAPVRRHWKTRTHSKIKKNIQKNSEKSAKNTHPTFYVVFLRLPSDSASLTCVFRTYVGTSSFPMICIATLHTTHTYYIQHSIYSTPERCHWMKILKCSRIIINASCEDRNKLRNRTKF